MGLKWAGLYGVNNTYGLAVMKETAERYGLRRISDLRNIARSLKFGAEYDFFERPDGYEGLCEAYGLEFMSNSDIDIGLKYQALRQGSIDVLVVFTTDGQLHDENIISNADMAEMNYQAEVEGRDPADIARDFLKR